MLLQTKITSYESYLANKEKNQDPFNNNDNVYILKYLITY
jgi:hypothetical protein